MSYLTLDNHQYEFKVDKQDSIYQDKTLLEYVQAALGYSRLLGSF